MTTPTSGRRVLFICTHNAGRSIAAALLNANHPRGVTASSAGTDPADQLNSTVVTAPANAGSVSPASAPEPSPPSCWPTPTSWSR